MSGERYREAARLLDDPSTPADVLAHIAEEFPPLRDGVARHPQAYPGLIAWIAANPAPPPAPANRHHRIGLIAVAAVAALALIAAATTGTLAITRAVSSVATGDTGVTDEGTNAASGESGGGAEPGAEPGEGTSADTGEDTDGTDTVGDDTGIAPIVFILDASGSMVREAAPGAPAWTMHAKPRSKRSRICPRQPRSASWCSARGPATPMPSGRLGVRM